MQRRNWIWFRYINFTQTICLLGSSGKISHVNLICLSKTKSPTAFKLCPFDFHYLILSNWMLSMYFVIKSNHSYRLPQYSTNNASDWWLSKWLKTTDITDFNVCYVYIKILCVWCFMVFCSTDLYTNENRL